MRRVRDWPISTFQIEIVTGTFVTCPFRLRFVGLPPPHRRHCCTKPLLWRLTKVCVCVFLCFCVFVCVCFCVLSTHSIDQSPVRPPGDDQLLDYRPAVPLPTSCRVIKCAHWLYTRSCRLRQFSCPRPTDQIHRISPGFTTQLLYVCVFSTCATRCGAHVEPTLFSVIFWTTTTTQRGGIFAPPSSCGAC